MNETVKAWTELLSVRAAVPVRLVREASGAACKECGVMFTIESPGRGIPADWTWRKWQLHHEREAGHRMQIFAVRQLSNVLTFSEADAVAQLDTDPAEGASNFYSDLLAALREHGEVTVRLER